MTLRWNWFFFIVLGLVVLGLAGCGKPPVQPSTEGGIVYNPASDPLVNPPSLFEPAPADRSQIDTEGTLYLNLDGSPQNLNPIFASSGYEMRILSALYEGPFTFDASMEWKINPVWVESYEEAPDHLSATMKLKPGLKWHDGQPVTAHDIVFSWQVICDDRVPCPAVKVGTMDVVDCVAVDDLTVKYVHKAAVATAKWNIQFPIIPKHLYEKERETNPDLKTGDYYTNLNRYPVGSGMYTLKEWVANERIVLERWEDYPGPKPNFKTIVFRLIPDPNAQLLAFEKEDLDCVLLNGEQFAQQTTTSEAFKKIGYKIMASEWSYGYIGWNMDGSNPFFQDKRVRIAMTHALNIPLILDKVYYNLTEPCVGIYHKDSWMYNPAVVPLPFDLEKTKQLLDEAGWLTDTQDGWRYKEIDGQRIRFSFTMSIPQGAGTSVKIANYFQDDLRSIGVEMKTRTIEWATYMQQVQKHEFEACVAAWGTGTDPDTGWNLWRTEEYEVGRNYGGYSNPRVDELFELGRKEFDRVQRAKIYQEIHKIIYEDQPYTFIAYRPSLFAINQRIQGVQTSPRGIFDFDPGYTKWWTRPVTAN
ncbi:MAG: ABC transporter substrate-binding protein [bacterium]|jgi:peptide/nickel transport system substrate-binding protein|nr:ABC transporter substrate-binding protein [bacterium]